MPASRSARGSLEGGLEAVMIVRCQLPSGKIGYCAPRPGQLDAERHLLKSARMKRDVSQSAQDLHDSVAEQLAMEYLRFGQMRGRRWRNFLRTGAG
jgi:hypothetical protein